MMRVESGETQVILNPSVRYSIVKSRSTHEVELTTPKYTHQVKMYPNCGKDPHYCVGRVIREIAGHELSDRMQETRRRPCGRQNSTANALRPSIADSNSKRTHSWPWRAEVERLG